MKQSLQDYLTNPPGYYKNYLNDKSETINAVAERQTLSLFHEAALKVPAYKDFLKKNKINHTTISTADDLQRVPFTDKENYILTYDLTSRCWNGQIRSTHAFATSSGSSGEPIFWPRNIEQEMEGAHIHEYLLENIYGVRERSTLVVNGFGLGNWIAGMYTQHCLMLNKIHGVPFTLASPGYNQEEIWKVIRSFSPHYEQTILIGHPPIIKILLEEGMNLGIDWKKLNMKFLGAAEGFSENWRDYVLQLAHAKDPLRTFINIYGSADAGLMGFETPLSILIHRETQLDHALNKQLFKSERSPYLYQYDPRMRYMESVDGHITITSDATMPLIRYNIYDHGYTLANEELLQITDQASPQFRTKLKQNQLSENDWNLPFVYIFGRDQFMVTLYGVNIYPENIKAVLEKSELQTYLTGRFSTEKLTDAAQDHYLQLRLELKPSVRQSKKLATLTNRLFITTLKQLNSEYNQVEDKFKQKMHPQIKFHRFHHPDFFPDGKIKKMG